MSPREFLDLSAGGDSVTFSFELFPPRSEVAAVSLAETVRILASTDPTFMSVTYGASGSSREASFELLQVLQERTSVIPLAHLTSIGSQRDELIALIRALMDSGIYDFLALRGDPPAGSEDESGRVNSAVSSAELVRLIADERALRAQQSTRAGLGTIAVAAYPNGHERSIDRATDIEMLIEKQEAGADFAITQLFFYAEDYLGFVSEARDAGLTIPVLPGLMPVSTAPQLRRIAELAGQAAPSDLLHALENAGEAAPALGIDFTVRLAQELIDDGTRSLHLYTFNKHEAVMSVLSRLRLLPQSVEEAL